MTLAPYGSTGASVAGPSTVSHHIVLIDFGKATPFSGSRLYNLSETEQVEYWLKFPHIAPEVGNRQSIYSDIYSVGKIF